MPDVEGDKPAERASRPYPIGYHVDIAEAGTAEGGLHLHAAIDHTGKSAFARLAGNADRVTASAFLKA